MFAQATFDLSTLPKVRTHANLGNLGACTWYTPWDCYTPTNVQAAKTELEQAHYILIDFTNATRTFYDDAVSGGATQSVIDGLSASFNDGLQLVRDHTAIMNEFYAKTGVTAVAGLVTGNGTRLGWVTALMTLAPILGAALRQIVWVYLASIVGGIADTFVQNSKTAQEKLKTRGEYYIAWRQAKEQGVEPPPAPPNGDNGDWLGSSGAILALIAIAAAGIIFARGR